MDTLANKIFRFEGFIELNTGDEVVISEWREVKEGLPNEALLVTNRTTNKEFKSRTKNVKMLKPISKIKIKGKILGLKEKVNIKAKEPVILFEVEIK